MPRTTADWLVAFDAALQSGTPDGVAALFVSDCYWRDLLAFSWNIITLEGCPQIVDMLTNTLAAVRPGNWQIDGAPQGDTAWITFETPHGWGEGQFTLRNGLCHTMLTSLRDLKGHEELKGPRRPKGVTQGAGRNRQTWAEARQEQSRRIGIQDQPYCLIIGGGQGGLALGARLRALGVQFLIVEKNARAGDSWRNRYRSLVLHDPVWYDHMPYLPFPETWPVFTPKDKMGDWLEAYASLFELDIWTSSTVTAAQHDGTRWTVQVDHAGSPVTLTPTQLVFATGAYGPPRGIDWPGAESFAGQILHSSAYAQGSAYASKRCVVVGAASSAHDVAMDLWEAGAEVTMIQRTPTIVVRSETLMDLGFEIYSEAAVASGITVEKADMISAATPYGLFTAGQQALYRKIRVQDMAFYDRLAASGFALDFGADDSGLMIKALRTASGYYIDVGASDLIIGGQISVISGDAVASVTPTGLRLSSGRTVPADVIIACTGFQSMNETVAHVVSRDVADAVGPCWGLGSGVRGDPGPWLGELRNMWKPTAQEGLWFHGGNLALSRFYSRFVALQIKARLEGIPTPVYGRPLAREN